MVVRNCDLAAEKMVLEGALAVHQAKTEYLVTKMESAETAFETWFGFHPSKAPEYAPGWVTLKEELEAHCEQAYWALARFQDLKMLVGSYPGDQLMFHSEPLTSGRNVWKLGGDVPAAKPEVWTWLTKTMMEGVS